MAIRLKPEAPIPIGAPLTSGAIRDNRQRIPKFCRHGSHHLREPGEEVVSRGLIYTAIYSDSASKEIDQTTLRNGT